MKTIRTITITLLALFLSIMQVSAQENVDHKSGIAHSNKLFFGQKPPGRKAEIFAPGIISTVEFEWSFTVSLDKNELYFTRFLNGHNEIWVSSFDSLKLDNPHPAGFSNGYKTEMPAISPDEKNIFYTAFRAREVNEDYYGHGDIWVAEKSDTGWSNHHPINLSTHPYYGNVSPASSGTLYSGTI
jgi:hypothetical protein